VAVQERSRVTSSRDGRVLTPLPAVGEDGNLTYDEMRARQPDKYKAFVPGKPEPDEYNLVNFSPYKIHQRLAERLRVGRILLAADAAHLCNPL